MEKRKPRGSEISLEAVPTLLLFYCCLPTLQITDAYKGLEAATKAGVPFQLRYRMQVCSQLGRESMPLGGCYERLCLLPPVNSYDQSPFKKAVHTLQHCHEIVQLACDNG